MRSTRGVPWLAIVVAGAITFVGAALAQPTDRLAFSSRPTAQTFVAKREAVITSSTEFAAVTGLATRIRARGAITATVSGDFSGAPVEIRVQGPGGRTLQPGPARFESLGDLHAFSYTFGTKGEGRGACVRVAVEWRSPTGEQVILNDGALAVNYRRDAKASCRDG